MTNNEKIITTLTDPCSYCAAWIEYTSEMAPDVRQVRNYAMHLRYIHGLKPYHIAR